MRVNLNNAHIQHQIKIAECLKEAEDVFQDEYAPMKGKLNEDIYSQVQESGSRGMEEMPMQDPSMAEAVVDTTGEQMYPDIPTPYAEESYSYGDLTPSQYYAVLQNPELMQGLQARMGAMRYLNDMSYPQQFYDGSVKIGEVLDEITKVGQLGYRIDKMKEDPAQVKEAMALDLINKDYFVSLMSKLTP